MGKIYKGADEVTKMFKGSTEILKVYKGPTLVWENTDTTPPSNVTGVIATDNGLDIGVVWDAATDNVGVVGYDVYRSVNGGSYLLYDNVGVTGYTDVGVVSSNNYTYGIKAEDAAGNTSVSFGTSNTIYF